MILVAFKDWGFFGGLENVESTIILIETRRVGFHTH